MEMVENRHTQLTTRLLLKVTDLLKPKPTRSISPSQLSTVITNSAFLVHRVVAWHASSQAAELQSLMEQLLLVVPEEVEVVSAALTAIPLLPNPSMTRPCWPD